MFQKNSMTRRICYNGYVCLSNMQYKNKTPACLQYYFQWAVEQKKLQYIKISKRKSDDGLEILEKPVKMKQILLNSYFGCSSTSN